MSTSCNILSLLLLTLITVGCQTANRPGSNADDVAAKGNGKDDDTHVGPPIETVHAIMRAKLAHGHGVLEGLTRQNYDQIIANAKALNDLASKEAWGVHRTMEYNLYSDQIRWYTGELKRHAEERKLHAATMDYMQMVNTCVRCHDYMNQENLIMEQPFDLPDFLARGTD